MESTNINQSGLTTIQRAQSDLATAASSVAQVTAGADEADAGNVREALAHNPEREARAAAGAEVVAAEDRMLGALIDLRA